MNSVIKGASYVLVHTPDMVLYNGTTQTTEKIVNPESEYLKEVPKNLRSYEEAVSYWPNQTYIGNVHPDELAEVEFPWYDKMCIRDRFYSGSIKGRECNAAGYQLRERDAGDCPQWKSDECSRTSA